MPGGLKMLGVARSKNELLLATPHRSAVRLAEASREQGRAQFPMGSENQAEPGDRDVEGFASSFA